MWIFQLPLAFNPGEDVCIDEQLVPFRGRCAFRQYMPSKPGKYGLKIWTLCDVETAYVWNMQPYLGKASRDAAPEKQQGKRVVMDLTEGLRGNTVTTDNFFTSWELGMELQTKIKLALVGTIRRNRPELPPQLLDVRQRQARSSVFTQKIKIDENHCCFQF